MFFTAPGKRRFCSRRTYQSCPSSQQLFQAFVSSLLLLMGGFFELYMMTIYICVWCRWIYMCVLCNIDRLHPFCGCLPDSLKVIGPCSSLSAEFISSYVSCILAIASADCSRCALARDASIGDWLAAAKVGSRWDCCCTCCMPTIQSRDSRNASSQPFSAVGGSWWRNSGFIAGYVCKFDRLEVADKLLWFDCNKFVCKPMEE